MLRRLAPLAALTVFASGCGAGQVISPTAETVIGKVAVQTYPVPPAYAKGDPVAGRVVFTTKGCTACHTLKDAGATGNVGPDLDVTKPPLGKVILRVLNGKAAMPPFKGVLSTKQIADVAAYVVKATQSG